MNRKETILIVDDEPASRSTLEALLLPLGMTLVFAANGREALRAAAEVRPDLILLDVMMPGMDGFEVCRRLRAERAQAEVPVILITALDDAHSRLTGIEAGADDFITKPFERDLLRARVKNTLSLNRYRRLVVERSRFEWVVRNADEGYLAISSDDRIEYANARAAFFLGLPGEGSPAEGRSFLDLVDRRYARQPGEAWQSWPHLSQGGTSPARYLIQTGSATARPFWLRVDVLDTPGTPGDQKLIRLRDVTASEALARDMWAFESVILHKLNTPLTPLVLGLEHIEPALQAVVSPEIALLFAGALRAARRLQSEVADVTRYLHLNAVEASGEGLPLSGLPDLVNGLKAELGLAQVATSVSEKVADGFLPIAPRAAEMILRELLGNSQKFHPRRSPAVEVVIWQSGPGEIGMAVTDDGVGCSQGELEKIWDPYYQSEASFTGQVPGMGLGLAMVRSLMWECGGRCSARNREGLPGLVVELIFPAGGGR